MYCFSSLNNDHDRASFDCGVVELNRFLKEEAKSYVKRGLCAVHVFADGNTIIGYYTLSASSITTTELPADLAKKYPKNLHVPCWILGRLAVDKRFQRKGLGEKLLMAAFSKVLDITQDAGGYCLIVDVKNNDVRNFYRKYGFLEFAGNSSRFYLPLASIPV